MPARLFEMGGQSISQLARLRGVDHFRKRLDDLMLRIVEIAKFVDIQLVQAFEFHEVPRTSV